LFASNEDIEACAGHFWGKTNGAMDGCVYPYLSLLQLAPQKQVYRHFFGTKTKAGGVPFFIVWISLNGGIEARAPSCRGKTHDAMDGCVYKYRSLLQIAPHK
jgi:hypothetical protein